MEARREATEAMKQLNAETQHVLDDEVDDKWLAAVEQALDKTAKNFNQAFSQKSGFPIVLHPITSILIIHDFNHLMKHVISCWTSICWLFW